MYSFRITIWQSFRYFEAVHTGYIVVPEFEDKSFDLHTLAIIASVHTWRYTEHWNCNCSNLENNRRVHGKKVFLQVCEYCLRILIVVQRSVCEHCLRILIVVRRNVCVHCVWILIVVQRKVRILTGVQRNVCLPFCIVGNNLWQFYIDRVIGTTNVCC